MGNRKQEKDRVMVSTSNVYHISSGEQSSTLIANAVFPLPSKGMEDFPGGAVVKNPPANAGDTGSSPGLGRSHMPRSN